MAAAGRLAHTLQQPRLDVPKTACAGLGGLGGGGGRGAPRAPAGDCRGRGRKDHICMRSSPKVSCKPQLGTTSPRGPGFARICGTPRTLRPTQAQITRTRVISRVLWPQLSMRAPVGFYSWTARPFWYTWVLLSAIRAALVHAGPGSHAVPLFCSTRAQVHMKSCDHSRSCSSRPGLACIRRNTRDGAAVLVHAGRS